MKPLTIAIDGPAGAGKSSVAKVLAARLHYLYIDTGAMYRAFTWALLQKNAAPDDEKAVQELLDTLDIRLEPLADLCRVFVNDTEVTDAIRTQAVSSHVSEVAALPAVREKLVELQRKMAAGGGVILDGRDIGTVVLPKADLKVFLTASVESRARRRYLEMQEKGSSETYADIAKSIQQRDDMDTHRAVSPLKKAADAIVVDNSDLDLQQTADAILALIKGR